MEIVHRLQQGDGKCTCSGTSIGSSTCTTTGIGTGIGAGAQGINYCLTPEGLVRF